ncbi:DNA-directed RNA polymerase subunit omega [Actibacterium mucosum KCTC 23349]|uniref:DNA-directed RNA polymerase subunit omega n=1 Tax=Actibacterium mucosum KCTC 23349 TaxID=1454373 RepID=A0A037ZQ37_9RHOB|nr:DUF2062 domain-containing protein [Actibacterium mucosum]KAJ56932.1 DNA-directed RNA polymerase subunit omega [Actibacterium mucosum KCTC 23349]
MVFKRREKRSAWQIAADFLWPRGGWGRAFQYLRHRVRRLPDSPERIARGVFAGVFTTFTPFYGLHFVIAALIARLMNGNILAALASTFFGNPLTYIPIGVISLKVGHFLRGTEARQEVDGTLVETFFGAAADLWRNLIALFTDREAHWDNLAVFYDEVFLPYLVGGIAPGIVAALVAYYLSLPVVTAYQKHRTARIQKKLELERQAKLAEQQDDAG